MAEHSALLLHLLNASTTPQSWQNTHTHPFFQRLASIPPPTRLQGQSHTPLRTWLPGKSTTLDIKTAIDCTWRLWASHLASQSISFLSHFFIEMISFKWANKILMTIFSVLIITVFDCNKNWKQQLKQLFFPHHRYSKGWWSTDGVVTPCHKYPQLFSTSAFSPHDCLLVTR